MRILSLIFLLLTGIVLSAEDVKITINTLLQGENLAVDSIRIDNLSNGTRLLLSEFGQDDSYVINLSKGEFWEEPSSNNSIAYANIGLKENLPGKIRLINLDSETRQTRVTIYNTMGRILLQNELEWESGAEAEVEIDRYGTFIIHLQHEKGRAVYRMMGSGNAPSTSINLNTGTPLKSMVTGAGDFSFEAGDSLSIVVYKAGYWADPLFLVIMGDEVLVFEFEVPGFTIVDARDQNEYRCVEIGKQYWMAENLAWLPDVYEPSSRSFSNPRYWVYGYDGKLVNDAVEEESYQLYGTLYNWKAALTACPEGWHLPSDEEWKEMEATIGLDSALLDETGMRAGVQGTLLKAASGWSEDQNGADLYGFTALPAGYYNGTSGFVDQGMNTYWWTADVKVNDVIWSRQLTGDQTGIDRSFDNGKMGFSVRCVKQAGEATEAEVRTLEAEDVSISEATLYGEVENDGGSAITSRGFYISNINEDPGLDNQVEFVDGTIGQFSIILQGLEPGITYYYKAFAENSIGISTGEVISFTTPEDNSVEIPTLGVEAATDITENTATLSGSIVDDGGGEVSLRGFFFSISSTEPDMANGVMEIVETSSANFSASLADLQPNTTYYYRSFAVNEAGTGMSEVLSFKTDEESIFGTMTDTRDGNKYKTVNIGNQTWMAENLAYLPKVNRWSENDLTVPHYYVFEYYGTSVDDAKLTNNYKTYGVLYNGAAAMNACPSGWHLPSDDEWKELELFVGVPQDEIDLLFGTRGDDEKVAGKLKSAEGAFWQGKTGTDDYGFGALDGGANGMYGFDSHGYGEWWTSTYYIENSFAYSRRMGSDLHGIWYRPSKTSVGLSVRCVED